MINYKIQSPVGLLEVTNYDTDKSIAGQLKQGVYEPHVQQMIVNVVKPDFRCVDIGANVGIHSLLLSKLCKDVACVEASPENISVLKTNYELNKLTLPTIYQEYVGNGNTVTFSRAESNHACSFTATTDHSQVNEVRETVTTKKIRDIIDYQPDFVKMDIEGAEYNTMTSSLDFFKNLSYMVIELNKFTNERFFNQPITLLTDLLLEIYNVYIPYNNQYGLVNKSWIDEFFDKNIMLDVLCINKKVKV